MASQHSQPKPCTCGGQNERCYRCSGTGIYEVVAEGQEPRPTVNMMAAATTSVVRTYQKNETQILRPRRLNCPVCGKTIGGLSSHMLAKHGQTLEQYKASLPPPPPIAPDDLVSCPDCKKLLAFRRLNEHRRVIHFKAQPTVAAHRSPLGVPPDTRVTGDTHTLQERRMDATRDHYAAYRDQGKFGSHAAHDDYGDESKS